MEYLTSLLLSFVSGGVICAAVQIIIDKTRLTPARILVSLVVVGIFLYSVGLFDPLREIFGSGVSVPLLGFGASIAEGTREAVDKVGLLGALTGGLTATAAGICATLSLGLILSLFCRGGAKRM